jgi:hypothetical protein
MFGPVALGAHHGCTIDRLADRFVRTRLDSGEALFRHRGEPRDLLQPAAQGLRIAPQAAVPLRQGGGRGPTRGHGERLRVREGPVRDVHARGAEGARGSGHAHRGNHRVRADRVGGPHLLRQDLLPRPGQGRQQALRAPRQGAARIGALRARPLGRPRQGVHRDDPPDRERERRRARHAAAALRGRGALRQGNRDTEDRRQGCRAEARAAAHRAAGLRHVQSRVVHRRSAQARRGGGAEEGRGPGSHPRRGARNRRRTGHRPHGSPAREPRQEEAGRRGHGHGCAARGNAQAAEAGAGARGCEAASSGG